MNSVFQTPKSLYQECTQSHIGHWKTPAIMPWFRSNTTSSQGPLLCVPGPTQSPSWNPHCMCTHLKVCISCGHSCCLVIYFTLDCAFSSTECLGWCIVDALLNKEMNGWINERNILLINLNWKCTFFFFNKNNSQHWIFFLDSIKYINKYGFPRKCMEWQIAGI